MQFCKQRGPRKKAAGTQCIDRKWKSLKQWIPKELRNKQKITRDVNMCLRSFVEQTGETPTRWKTWPNWLAGPESPKKTEKKTRALEFDDGPQ